ncbi:MAG: hypothetical protein WKF79_13020 [Nocardioides sp.]
MLKSLRNLVAALSGGIVMIGIASSFVLPEDAGQETPVWLWLGIVGLGIAVFLLLETIGYRTAAIAPGTPAEAAERTSRMAFSTGTILRCAGSESVAVASLALAFVFGGGITTYAVGAVVALALIAFHAWPSARPIEKTRASLERDGAVSHLHLALGLPPASTGPIQEL